MFDLICLTQSGNPVIHRGLNQAPAEEHRVKAAAEAEERREKASAEAREAQAKATADAEEHLDILLKGFNKQHASSQRPSSC